MSARQITFDLAPDPSFEAEDFLVSPSNARAWTLFESWPDWPDRILALVGPMGVGKTHLARIWARRAGAYVVPADQLGDEAGECAARAGAALIEDADRRLGGEADLFHFLNRARAEKIFVLITARAEPALWGLQTADLISRLRQAPVVMIGHPDDALMRAVMVKLVVDRQLLVDANVLEYAALRLERSLDCARRFIEELDREGLARSRPITRALASEVLTRMGSLAE